MQKIFMCVKEKFAFGKIACYAVFFRSKKLLSPRYSTVDVSCAVSRAACC